MLTAVMSCNICCRHFWDVMQCLLCDIPIKTAVTETSRRLVKKNMARDLRTNFKCS